MSEVPEISTGQNRSPKKAGMTALCLVSAQKDTRAGFEFFFHYQILEIKPCGLGSRIRDMEANMVNIFDFHGGC